MHTQVEGVVGVQYFCLFSSVRSILFLFYFQEPGYVRSWLGRATESKRVYSRNEINVYISNRTISRPTKTLYSVSWSYAEYRPRGSNGNQGMPIPVPVPAVELYNYPGRFIRLWSYFRNRWVLWLLKHIVYCCFHCLKEFEGVLYLAFLSSLVLQAFFQWWFRDGFSGFACTPPPPPAVFKYPMKMKKFGLVRPNYFYFHGIFYNNKIISEANLHTFLSYEPLIRNSRHVPVFQPVQLYKFM